jgi:hypothetical protein
VKKVLKLLLLLVFSVFTLNCKTDTHEDISDQYRITVNFEYGINLSPTAYKNIYVIWIEDTTSNFIQNISICQKLIVGGLTGTALPYWKVNKYPGSQMSEIDAVTSATKANTNFSVSAVLKDNTVRKFVLYFEVDRAYEPNDWFSDQPALLYSVKIDLDDIKSEYELLPTGWTPNEITQNVIPNTPKGKLQTEMRYITNLKSGLSFGGADSRTSTKMVNKITAVIESSLTTQIFDKSTDDLSISIYPNPTHGRVNLMSSEIINDIIVSNLQGQTIFYIQPKAFQFSFFLDKTKAPAGSYLAKIVTSKSVSVHKLLIIK